jgi:radical SAM superfamily enzyme YgiQ (UPF0313 family)
MTAWNRRPEPLNPMTPRPDGYYEQGPIRPPSEAHSLLVRVSRNCPWNRCAFCPVYKGADYSRRPVEEVLADLDAMRARHGEAVQTVFLQDANALQAPVADLLRILAGLKERFPRIARVTSYARSATLARRSDEDLARLRGAGLTRLHVGLESGCDAVLTLIDKGANRARQIEAGQRAMRSGFELSLYVMPGLGGRALSDAHADDTASAVAAVAPHFVRLRSIAVIPGTPLQHLVDEGRFEPLSDLEMLAELRRLLAGLEGTTTRLESDHVLNLLPELRGDLPEDHARLLNLLEAALALPLERQRALVLFRCSGRPVSVDELTRDDAWARLAPSYEATLAAHGGWEAMEALLADARTRRL